MGTGLARDNTEKSTDSIQAHSLAVTVVKQRASLFFNHELLLCSEPTANLAKSYLTCCRRKTWVNILRILHLVVLQLSPTGTNVVLLLSPTGINVVLQLSPIEINVVLQLSPTGINIVLQLSPTGINVVLQLSPTGINVVLQLSPTGINVVLQLSPTEINVVLQLSPTGINVASFQFYLIYWWRRPQFQFILLLTSKLIFLLMTAALCVWADNHEKSQLMVNKFFMIIPYGIPTITLLSTHQNLTISLLTQWLL